MKAMKKTHFTQPFCFTDEGTDINVINGVAQSYTGNLHHTQDQDSDFKEWLKDLIQNSWTCLLEVQILHLDEGPPHFSFTF